MLTVLSRYDLDRQRVSMSRWDMEELVAFSVISDDGSVLADEIWRKRWERALGTLTFEVDEFSDVMAKNGVVVSGGMAVHILDGPWYHNPHPGDWDMYIPHDRFDTFTSYVRDRLDYPFEPWRDDEYSYNLDPDHTLDDHSVCVSGICGRRRIVTPLGTVDMLRSCTESALSPIPRFHSSAVMAYVGPTGFSIAYPLAMHARENIVASRDLRPSDKAGIEKYDNRGFKQCQDIRRCLRIGKTRSGCVGSGFCASQERYFGDRFCLSVSYPGPGLVGSHLQTFPDPRVVSWTRGGRGCGSADCSGFIPPKAVTVSSAQFDIVGGLIV